MSTWMVVEDEPDIYEVLLTMFEMWGIDGAAFVEGEEATAWINEVDRGRYPGELPELALIDIRLPGKINGVNVAERLRQSPKMAQIPIVFSTAYHLTPEEEEDIMKRTDADKIIYKPLPRFHELQRILEDIIAQRRVRTANPAATVRAEKSTPLSQPVSRVLPPRKSGK